MRKNLLAVARLLVVIVVSVVTTVGIVSYERSNLLNEMDAKIAVVTLSASQPEEVGPVLLAFTRKVNGFTLSYSNKNDLPTAKEWRKAFDLLERNGVRGSFAEVPTAQEYAIKTRLITKYGKWTAASQ